MIRRLIDICVAAPALVFLSPLFVLISMIVVLDSSGAPFYGGFRVGQNGRRFRMWKFRTMVRNADRVGGAITTPQDCRITRVGALLRKTKLDELPQFVNLLLGDVTLVGPRPEDPGITDRYSPEYRRIFRAKPGITGPTQLLFTAIEAETVPEGEDAQEYYVQHLLDQKIRHDLEYLEKRTFTSDLKVVMRTAMLVGRSLSHISN